MVHVLEIGQRGGVELGGDAVAIGGHQGKRGRCVNPADLVAADQRLSLRVGPGKDEREAHDPQVVARDVGIARLKDELPRGGGGQVGIERIERAGIEGGVIVGHVVAVDVVGDAVRRVERPGDADCKKSLANRE